MPAFQSKLSAGSLTDEKQSPQDISTQIYLLSTHLGAVAEKTENHQAVSSAQKKHLSNSLPHPKPCECWGPGNSKCR